MNQQLHVSTVYWFNHITLTTGWPSFIDIIKKLSNLFLSSSVISVVSSDKGLVL